MKSLYASLITIFMMINIVATDAYAGVICIKANGTLISRSKKCAKGETKGNINNIVSAGDSGQTGLQGPSGVAGNSISLGRVTQFSSQFLLINSGNSYVKEELCPLGKVSLGGGCISSEAGISVSDNYPFDSTPQQAWRCRFNNITAGPVSSTLTTLVICGDPP